MPRGDGTGPIGGGGPGTGRRARGGGRQGRMGGTRPGAGPQGACICPECGNKVQHTQGNPCYLIDCPNCGAKMVRG